MATSYHTRSNSFPSKPHPFASAFDKHLERLKSSQSTSTSSSSIGQSLNGLHDLYDSVDNLLQLQLTQQSLAQEHNQKLVQDLLDGSLMLLDICSLVTDILSQITKSTLDLQSTLRRRKGDETKLDEIKKYLQSRKVVKKAINKTLKNLKVKESYIVDEDNETKTMVNMLKEVEVMTLAVLKSLLSFISGPKTQSKLNRWSVVSKLMQSRRIFCRKVEDDANEFEKLDVALLSSIGHKSIDVFHLQNQLKDVEMCILDLEEGIECLTRRMIKTRVAFLNIFNN